MPTQQGNHELLKLEWFPLKQLLLDPENPRLESVTRSCVVCKPFPPRKGSLGKAMSRSVPQSPETADGARCRLRTYISSTENQALTAPDSQIDSLKLRSDAILIELRCERGRSWATPCKRALLNIAQSCLKCVQGKGGDTPCARTLQRPVSEIRRRRRFKTNGKRRCVCVVEVTLAVLRLVDLSNRAIAAAGARLDVFLVDAKSCQ